MIKGVDFLSVYESLILMISFGMLVATVINTRK
ncbi:putative holin-like toxin [Anaerovibrio sp.]